MEQTTNNQTINLKIFKFFGMAFLVLFILIILFGIFGQRPLIVKSSIESESTLKDTVTIYGTLPKNIGILTINKKEISYNSNKFSKELPLEIGKNKFEIIFNTTDKKYSKDIYIERIDKKTQMIKDQFSQWDGSHNNFSKLVKKSLNDPNSFDHIETRYKIKKNSIIIFMKFRAKNAFNALILNEMVAEYDLEGNFIKLYK